VLPHLARLRGEGRSADTDYAGRSLKGQLSHAAKRGADTVVVARPDGFEVRRRGEDDRLVQDLTEL
jgi:histidyl-tRNA synthetase